jgi:molybdate transport system substrate-binding protein
LEKIGLWASVQPKVVPMSSVRAALAAVREGRADAAIVYATDARTTSDVRVVYTVPAAEAPSIAYPAALVRGPREAEAGRFLTYLQSPEARRIFEAAGFGNAAPR